MRQLRWSRAPTTVSDQAREHAEQALGRPGVSIAPRKQWPTGLERLGVDLRGKIKEGAEEGRAVARLTDLGHGQRLRELFRAPVDPTGGPGGPVVTGADTGADTGVPEPLVRAVVEVLADWRPSVGAIAFVESTTRPTLTRDLADGLSRHLQVPVVGRFTIVDPDVPPGAGQANSAQRVAAVRRRFAWQWAPDRQGPPATDVLLVDDLVVTGWTLALAATSLRAAGVTAVRPMTLAVRS